MAIFPSGERYPALIRREDGIPLYWPNVFVATQLRPRSLAANTLEYCQRALLLLFTFADSRGIDLVARLESCRLLAPHELDDLAGAAHMRVRDIASTPRAPVGARARRPSASKLLGSSLPLVRGIDLHTVESRLRYIAHFLRWFTARRRGLLIDDPVELQRYSAAREAFLPELEVRIPRASRRRSNREGLPPDFYDRILQAVDPASPNPIWPSEAVRKRNFLMFLFYWLFGLRDGEVRSLYVADIHTDRDEFLVERRQDSPLDRRRRAPAVKTDGRPLPLLGLGPLVEDYLYGVREALTKRAAKRAKIHPFLFVSVTTGQPLSHHAIAKAFRQLAKAAGLPSAFSPHVLRHTWNDRFSKLMDSTRVDPEREKASRNFALGLADNSEISAQYTKRHDRAKAFAALLQMFHDLIRGS